METTAQKNAPELFGLPLARSRFGLPDDYEKARQTFAAAKKDYESGAPAKAALKFMQVAALVKAPKPATDYAAAFEKMRVYAYKDAALAFEEAGQREAGRKALTAALKDDPDNKETLKALLSKFS